jgi:hypothetical protein
VGSGRSGSVSDRSAAARAVALGSTYLDLPHRAVTHLVAIFGKRKKSDLSPAERRVVAALVKQLKEES